MATNVEKFPIFTSRFRTLRRDRSQAEFADFLEISRPTVGFYENGERIPDASTLARICEKCEVSADWLLGLTKDRKREPSAMDELYLSEESYNTLFCLSNGLTGDGKGYFDDIEVIQQHTAVLNSILDNPGFTFLVYCIRQAAVERVSFSKKNDNIDLYTPENMANIFEKEIQYLDWQAEKVAEEITEQAVYKIYNMFREGNNNG